MCASMRGHISIVEYLLSIGVNVNLVSKVSMTVSHSMAPERYGCLSVAFDGSPLCVRGRETVHGRAVDTKWRRR
jgi:ankyrin repeat protein